MRTTSKTGQSRIKAKDEWNVSRDSARLIVALAQRPGLCGLTATAGKYGKFRRSDSNFANWLISKGYGITENLS
jgi:hypothetical protein